MPDVGVRPDPSFALLLRPKWLTARARAMANERGRSARLVVLGGMALLFWLFIYTLLHRLLVYFRSVPDLGPFLAGKLLGLILVGFFSILLLSNIITALSSFFLARDLDLLVASPADWLKLYGAKLLETGVNSSWMVVLLAIPMFTAFGTAYHGGVLFPLIVAATFIPFLIVPTVIGSAITLLLVNVFPARRTKDILSVIAVLAAGGLVLLFRLMRPEQLARPEGFRSLIEFISILRAPTSPYLPSEWVQTSVMSWLGEEPDVFPLYMLWSTAAAFIVIGAMIQKALYPIGFSKAQESGERWVRKSSLSTGFRKLISPLGHVRGELVMKEVRLFFRDTT